MVIKFSKKWLENVVGTIKLARKIAKNNDKNETMAKNVLANSDVEEALLNIDNEEAKLYEKTIAAMTVEDDFSVPFASLVKVAISHGIVPTEETQALYDAEISLIAAKQAMINAIKALAEEKADKEE